MHNDQTAANTPEKTLIEAIALNRLIRAEYNGGEMLLAPHQLFSRNGELYLSAFNSRKSWRSDEDRRLGHFKLKGLSNVAMLDETFEPLPSFVGGLARVGDEHVFSVSLT